VRGGNHAPAGRLPLLRAAARAASCWIDPVLTA